MWSADALAAALDGDRLVLLDAARRAIGHGLESRRTLTVDAAEFSPLLQEPRACFVTLKKSGELRGCMGCLEATLPLVQAVAHYAHQAAFHDPRFPALDSSELADVSISISVLSSPLPIEFTSEADLLAQLQPGIDGVILSEGRRTATLLPQVWEHVAEPRVFVGHLKRKAGLAENYWSSTLKFERYRACSIAERHD